MFEEAWCSRCVHSDYREGKEIGDKDNPPCPIWMAHQLWAYELCNADPEKNPGKMILEMLITQREVKASDGISVFVNECQMFEPKDEGARIPGQMRIADAAGIEG